MKVAELIAALQKLPPEAEVFVEPDYGQFEPWAVMVAEEATAEDGYKFVQIRG